MVLYITSINAIINIERNYILKKYKKVLGDIVCNLYISLLYLILSFSITIIIYKEFGKYGLYCWMCLLVVICNIQTMKLSEIFGFTISLGNISYGALFLTTDILSEKYGKKSANDATKLSFVFMILFTVLMYLFLQYKPSETDFSQDAFLTIFNYIPRVTIGSLIAYYISQRSDVFLYNKLKQKYNKVWISNNISTIVSQVFDTLIFVMISFLGTMSLKEIFDLIITMICFKWIIAILDTPFMLLILNIKNNRELE